MRKKRIHKSGFSKGLVREWGGGGGGLGGIRKLPLINSGAKTDRRGREERLVE